MKKFIFIMTLIFSLLAFFSFSPKSGLLGDEDFIVMFYNLENFFDTINNPLKSDDEYTPNGGKHWTASRYNLKMKHIWQVISAVNNNQFPDVIGVCEVENRRCLEDLIEKTPLKIANYSIFYRESQDRRGIDVAFLYNRKTFHILDTNQFHIDFKSDSEYHSRDIMYMKGIVARSKDTLHILANHWPSKFSGEAQTAPLRYDAGKRLRSVIDSIQSTNNRAKILCIGDFNDSPDSKSLTEGLGTLNNWDSIQTYQLYNIAYYLQYKKKLWTYAYQDQYDILDQVIISGSLLEKKNLYINPDNVYPLRYNFMIKREADRPKPYRTYNGYKYDGGFSDHLPMIINFRDATKF
ncbi:MAG: hypothetical protein IKQ46_18635 [Bacteroidales bacterium]|nr:hypothetical protein [Bacteroidales bacterium]